MKQYLITSKVQEPYLTDWFYAENHFNSEIGMIVYDLYKNKYTKDGIKWQTIEHDHL